jgi:hypothetical protein
MNAFFENPVFKSYEKPIFMEGLMKECETNEFLNIFGHKLIESLRPKDEKSE